MSVVRRPSSVVRRPSSVVRRALTFLHFHLLLQNRWADFIQTWWGSSLGGRDPKLFMRSMWPPWGPGGGPLKEKKGVNFKNLLLQIQKQGRQDMLYEDTLIYEEYSLFMARPRMAPFAP